jgi:hypothetical protein
MTAVFGQIPPTKTTAGDIIIPQSTTVTKFIDDTGLTIGYVPPNWTVIDHDNTSPLQKEDLQQQIEEGVVSMHSSATLCPPYSKASSSISIVEEYGQQGSCEERDTGEVVVDYFPAMDINANIPQLATTRNPQTGLFELNLTAQTVLEQNLTAQTVLERMIVPALDIIVQNKTVPINITNPQDGTSWQVPGLLVLSTNTEDLNVNRIGLYFVDYTTGYVIEVLGPQGVENIEFGRPDIPDETVVDPRGDKIPIHGIGLDNLPPVMAEPMQIINSVSITRR